MWFIRNCQMTEAIWIRTLSMKVKIQLRDLEIQMSGRAWDLPVEDLAKAGRKVADLKVGSVGKAGQKGKGALTQ